MSEEEKLIDAWLQENLTEVQYQRFKLFMEGLSIREISKTEGIDYSSAKEYSPDIIFTYCVPKEREEEGWIKSNLDKIHNADVKYVLNLSDISCYEFTDKLKCIIENDGIDLDRPKPEIDEAIFQKEVEELKRKLGY